MFMKQCRIQDLNPTIQFCRLAGRLYSPPNMEEEYKKQWNDIDIEKEEAEDNDLDLWLFIYLNKNGGLVVF